eukprot:357074-Chlamydomonas_euryale.AAC.5
MGAGRALRFEEGKGRVPSCSTLHSDAFQPRAALRCVRPKRSAPMRSTHARCSDVFDPRALL